MSKCCAGSRVGIRVWHLFVVVTLMQETVQAKEKFKPAWQWNVSLTSALKGKAGSLESPMPHYACTDSPWKPYCPECKGRYQCTALTCPTCNGLCEAFDPGDGCSKCPGLNASVCDPASRSPPDTLMPCIMWRYRIGTCLPRLQLIEGTASPLATYFSQSVNGTGVISPGQASSVVNTARFRVSMKVKWGYLDFWGLLSFCSCDLLDSCDRCKMTLDGRATTIVASNRNNPVQIDRQPSPSDFHGLSLVEFSSVLVDGSLFAKELTLVLEGTFSTIQDTMLNMTFNPIKYYNSYRLRHMKLAPTPCTVQIEYEIKSPDLTIENGVQRQLMHVLGENNAPTITNPQIGYAPGCITKTPCVDSVGNRLPYSKFSDDPSKVYFGQYWRYEGTTDPLTITGFRSGDLDLDELCYFDSNTAASALLFVNQPGLSYFCGTMNLNVRAAIGSVTVNTRDGLVFYSNTRSLVGAVGLQSIISQAIASLTYRVETPEIVASKTSKVGFVNTQYDGAPEEYIVISLQDQGLTGADGLAKEAIDPLTGQPSLRINITIVASNNAPTISSSAQIAAIENNPFRFTRTTLSADDVDSDEVTTSVLAVQDWLGYRWNKPYLNKIRVTLELKGYGNHKGRGILYFDAAATQLTIVSNSSHKFVSIYPVFTEQDTCSVWSIINKPQIFQCDESSVSGMVGKTCENERDLFTCGTVATGRFGAQNASSNGTSFSLPIGDIEWQKQIETWELEIVEGSGKGQKSPIKTIVGVQVDLKNPFLIMPDTSSVWVIRLSQAHCKNIGINLNSVCVLSEMLPGSERGWLTSCPQGSESNCTCSLANTCEQDGKFLLYLNTSKLDEAQKYFRQITGLLSNYRKTCGSMPVLKVSNFSIGKPCIKNSDCNDANFPKCIPGVSCRCCSNLTQVCSANSECNRFVAGSFCGCQEGVEPSFALQPWQKKCCANILIECQNDTDCAKFGAGSRCGCMSGYGICNKSVGQLAPCTYRGIPQLDTSNSYTMYASNDCQAPLYSYEGTENTAVFNQLSFDEVGFSTKDPSFNFRGSTRIEFFASKRYAALAMTTMKYLTNNYRFPNYNRLYRIPLQDRDPTTFDITANDFDELHTTVNDMGNSGGSARDIKEAQSVSQILVAARNNAPNITAPASLTALEDVPLNILNLIQITDPDATDYGFNNALISATNLDGMGFQVNLTVQHGCIFINEGFFSDKEVEYAKRGHPLLGKPGCSLVAEFGILGVDACTIRLKDYGQPKYGLHAVKCTDSGTGCKTWEYKYCLSSKSSSEQPWCYARICSKFIAFEGRFPDVNSVLKNVTYVSEPDFNTFYGYTENLLVEVTDNGIIGDISEPLKASVNIPITVLPVNDAPAIGRLQSQQCITLNDDGSVDLSNVNAEDRVFSIDNTFDFVDVNEDTVFTFYPDRVWLLDNDAEEAAIRSTYITKCAGDCANPFDPVFGCCRGTTVCSKLCQHMQRASPGALPSQVLVAFSVDFGLLSFYPPSTRPMLTGLDFLTNLTLKDITNGGEVDLCPKQETCMRNQSRIWIRGRIPIIQNALQWGYLTFVGAPHFVGDVTLNIWISDDGYSDSNYTLPKTATATLAIQVVGVNNPPTIIAPVGSGCSCSSKDGTCQCAAEPPLTFSSGFRCFNNWMEFSVLTVNAVDCENQNSSRIPNQRDSYKAFPSLSREIQFFDVDFVQDASAYVTVELVLGRKGVGKFFLTDILTTVEYFQWEESDGLKHLRMKGELRNINFQMTSLYLDVQPDYSGPSPILVSVNDNSFYGVCTPKTDQKPYQCKRSSCKNLYGQEQFGSQGYFICKQPVANRDTLYTWLPGGGMSCSKITGVLPAANLRWAVGLWSGPFSCLGCGYYDKDFKTVSGTTEPPVLMAQQATSAIQAVVIGASACQFSTCLGCNAAPEYLSGPHGDGCGWCPGFCGGRGKCMIGLRKPIFETCIKDPKTGLDYRQCLPSSINLALIIGTSVPGGLAFFLLVYTFVRWMQRRHGSLVVYVKKKHFDIMHHGRKLSIVPPATASYLEFFVTILLALIIGLFSSGLLQTDSGPFHFQQEFYLDSSNELQFILDNCNLRFVPTRNYPFPTSAIEAIKIRFAYSVDPSIQLIADTCPAIATFEMVNDLAPSMKYKSFYCNIEVLVPDRYIMPKVVVNAKGLNQTTIRSGPMDKDTQNFGLDFGPNEFIIKGNTISARIDNLTANHFEFNVLHGYLLLTNVYSTSFANFNTLDADVVVTTPIQTSAQVWQKSENLVCLSAATLFVDSNCKEVCNFVPQPKAKPSDTSNVDFRAISRNYRRRLLSTTCPVQIPGCTNSDCTLIQTDQCLCKPTCDMVSAANLNFDGVKGIKGTCNGNGQCCRTICEGYSEADLFPFQNSVRCGLCVVDGSCSPPTCGAWSPGKLAQQFWFTSESGQISLSVFDSSVDANLGYHSFRGSSPANQVQVAVDFNLDDKNLLDELFHPGGKPNPISQWFWLRVIGPGAPPSTFGNFAWFLSVRYLVLPPYFLFVASYDTLTPRKSSGTIRLRPGFCPAYIDYGTSSSATSRIITLYQLLSDTLQTPPGSSTYPFPFGSLISWLPISSSPTRFSRDSSTNQLGLSPIEPWTGEGPVLYMAILLAGVFPVSISTLVVLYGVFVLRKHLREERYRKVMQQNAVLDLFEHMRLEQLDEAERMIAEEITEDDPRFKSVRAQIDVWYFIDCCFADPEQPRSFTSKVATVFTHLGIVSGPILYLNFMAVKWNMGNRDFYCENRIDKGTCFAEKEPLTDALNWFVLVFALFSILDLSFHYLTIAYIKIRVWLRIAYYILFGVAVWLALGVLLLTAAWILYGAMQLPLRLAPFALSGVSCGVIALFYFTKHQQYLKVVTQLLNQRVAVKTSQIYESNPKLPQRLVDIIASRIVDTALVQNGFSIARVLGRTFILVSITICIYSFVLIGFQAFVDFADHWSGLLNVCIVILIPYLVLAAFQGPKSLWENEEAENMGEKIFKTLDNLLASMESQLNLAEQVIESMPRQEMELIRFDDDQHSSDGGEAADGDQAPLLRIA